MCLLTATEVPSLVEKDLQVFKLFQPGTTITVHREFFYTLNQLFQTDMLLSRDGTPSDQTSQDATFEIDPEGFPDFFSNRFRLSVGCTYNFVGQGFHAYETEARARLGIEDLEEQRGGSFEMRTAIIPAGSLVYRDNTGLIVSNQIIIK